jgi:CDP-diglyceride synthetase
MVSWRRIIFGLQGGPGAPPGEPDRFLSLIEVRTARRIALLVAVAIAVLWGMELHSGVVAPHDQIGLPGIGLTMLALYVRLRRDPTSLLSCQRIAVVMVMAYFLMCSVTAMMHAAGTLSPYWTANNLQWLWSRCCCIFPTLGASRCACRR